jgi:propanol-preferring alcohol dehydrogenase
MRSHQELTADDTVVVIGVGGLGHMAVQLLRQIAPVYLIACDIDDKRLEQAKELGADEVINNKNADEAAEKIRKITGPRGAELVLDCIGVQPTFDLGQKLLGRNSVWTIVGLGGGHHDFTHGSTPYGTTVCIPYWGSRIELMEVIAMQREGRINVETENYPLDQAAAVYDKLRAGEIVGRAVLVP